MKVIILASLLCLPLFAVESTEGQDKEPEGKKVQYEGSKTTKKAKYVVANESELNREDKKFMAVMSWGSNYSTSSGGLTLSYFLDSDSLINLSYFDLSDDNTVTDDYDDGTAIELSFKQFNGNSFYFQVYGYYRSIEETDRTNSFLFSSPDGFYRLKDAGLGIKIGNQWQWDNFTIGCDWIGLGRRIAKFSEEGSTRVFSFTSERTHVTALNLYLGFAF
jgi:hypothetical protein